MRTRYVGQRIIRAEMGIITIIIWVMSSPVSQSTLIIPSWSVWWTQADLEVSEQAWHQSAFTQHCDNIIKLMQNYCANCSGWISMRILYGAQMCKQVNNNHLDNLHSCLSGNWQAQVIIPSPKNKLQLLAHNENRGNCSSNTPKSLFPNWNALFII